MYCNKNMVVIKIKSNSDYNSRMASKTYAMTVVMFSSKACGPCRQIMPDFKKLSVQYGQKIQFLKVCIDDHWPIATAARVTGLPTFIFYKDGANVAQVVGANLNKLEQALKNFEKDENDDNQQQYEIY